MKLGIIPEGPADRLIARAKKLNPTAPIVVVDSNTFKDPDIFAVLVFQPFRDRVDHFNSLREKLKLHPFVVVDVPLSSFGSVRNSMRARIIEILKEGPAYGYEVFKKYQQRHGKVSLRLIYYHLTKGAKDGIFEVADVKEARGDFSWGPSTKRKYYRLKFPV